LSHTNKTDVLLSIKTVQVSFFRFFTYFGNECQNLKKLKKSFDVYIESPVHK